jgi:small-conductance mechanosensitive channel
VAKDKAVAGQLRCLLRREAPAAGVSAMQLQCDAMRIVAGIVIIVVAAMGSAGIRAQDADRSGTPPAEAPAPEAARQPGLSAPELNLKLDEIAAHVAEVESELARIGDLLEAKRRLDVIRPEVDARLAPLTPAALAGASPLVRDGLAQVLHRLDVEIATARAPLDRRVQRLEDVRQSLRAESALIEAAQATAAAMDLPAAMQQRMLALLERLEVTRGMVRRALDATVTETERAALAQRSIASTLRLIDEVARSDLQPTLAPDRPPLWRVPWEFPVATLSPREHLAALRVAASEAMRAYPLRTLLLPLLLVAALALTWRLRRASRTGAAPAPSDALFVRHPTAAAVLIWGVSAPELVGLELPAGADILRSVIVVAAAWPMLGLIAPPGAQRPLKSLLLLAVLATWLLVVLGHEAGSLGFLAMGLLGLFLLQRLAGAMAAAASGSQSRRALLMLGIRFGQILLAAGIVTLAFGYARLGQQLVQGVLFLTLVPALLAVASQTLQGLWYELVERAGRRGLLAARNHPALMRQRGRQLINLALLILTLPLATRIFPFTAPLWERLGEMIRAKLEVGGISLSLLDVLTLFIGIAVALVIARFVRFTLEEDVMTRLPVAPGAASAASRLLFYLLVTVGLLMAIAASGFELDKLTLVVSALGVGLGFGLQNVVSNFVSGIVLAFERPFQVGDLIAVEESSGRVLRIGLRSTAVRTIEGAEVIVPNSTFISDNVINWTLSDRMRRIQMPVGVAYGSEPRRVLELLREAVVTVPDVAREPEPVVVFTGFGESALDFRVLVWTPDADRLLQTTSELGLAIHDALRAAGIGIPYPQREVHLRRQPVPPAGRAD